MSGWKRMDFDDWSPDGPGSFTWTAIGTEGRDYPIALIIQKDHEAWGDGSTDLAKTEAKILAVNDLLEALKEACNTLALVADFVDAPMIAEPAQERHARAVAAIAKATTDDR